MKLLIVSGLSGSGKSVALKTLEDAGYYCVDNLPANLLPSFVKELKKNSQNYSERAAVGVDARAHIETIEQIPHSIERLKKKGVNVELLFLHASDDTLLKRFSETRRAHPLTHTDHPLLDAIHYEKDILATLSNLADVSIDTTHLSNAELKSKVLTHFDAPKNSPIQPSLSLLFQSFGFKHGIPSDTNFIFDVRCLNNPHWQSELRPLTGKSDAVAQYLNNHSETPSMIRSIIDFIEHWLPEFENEHRRYMTISIGCTGGQHRSVYIVEQLAQHFSRLNNPNRTVHTRHRELD